MKGRAWFNKESCRRVEGEERYMSRTYVGEVGKLALAQKRAVMAVLAKALPTFSLEIERA